MNGENNKKRALWPSRNLSLALEGIRAGHSQREMSQRYGIPRRTLRNHIKSGKTDKKLGRSSLLTLAQEAELVNRLVRFAEIYL